MPSCSRAEPVAIPLNPDEAGESASWLYVSKRLDLRWLPNVSLWTLPAITFTSDTSNDDTSAVTFYRLSAQVLVWLNACGHYLEAQYLTGHLDRNQLDVYLGAMAHVWRFTGEHIEPAAVEAAKGQPAALPDVVAAPGGLDATRA